MNPESSAAPAAFRRDDSARSLFWLGAAGVGLPWLQTLEWDFDRSALLVLLAPALWTGRLVLGRALGRLARAPRIWQAVLIALAAALAASVLASPQPAAALVESSRWILLGLGALLAGQLLAEQPARANWLLGALALAGAGATLLHWLRWKSGAAPEAAFYSHHRLMGLHLMGAAVAATAFAATATAPLARRLGLGLGLLTWSGLLWSGGRAPLLALAGGLLTWFALAPAALRRRLAVLGLVFTVGGLAISAALPTDRPWLGWTRIWQRTVAPEPGVGVTSHRADFWQSTGRFVSAHPWLGRGPDAYRYLEPKLEGAQPHNVMLQCLLDLGLAGTLPVLALTGLTLARGWRRLDRGGASGGWLALAVASAIGGQLDGFFYHLLGLFPAALALGACALAGPTAAPVTAPVPARRWAIPALAASAVLLVHTWLFYRVARAPVPAPDSLPAAVWRNFPTCTLGLERWIETWTPSAPDAALALSRQAQLHSPNGDFFRVQTAGLLLRRGDRAGALQELDHALAIAPWQIRPVISELRQKVAPPSP